MYYVHRAHDWRCMQLVVVKAGPEGNGLRAREVTCIFLRFKASSIRTLRKRTASFMFCILIHSPRLRCFPCTQITLRWLYYVTQWNYATCNNATCCWCLMSIMISIMTIVTLLVGHVRCWCTRFEKNSVVFRFYLRSVFSKPLTALLVFPGNSRIFNLSIVSPCEMHYYINCMNYKLIHLIFFLSDANYAKRA